MQSSEPDAASGHDRGRPSEVIGKIGHSGYLTKTSDPADSAATAREVEVKTEHDVNLLNNQPVVRIFARYAGTRRWSRFVVYVTKNEPADYIVRHAREIAEKWLATGAPR